MDRDMTEGSICSAIVLGVVAAVGFGFYTKTVNHITAVRQAQAAAKAAATPVAEPTK